MSSFLEFIAGYKTKLAAVFTAIAGVLSAFGVEVPQSVLIALAAFGLYSVRDAIAKLEDSE